VAEGLDFGFEGGEAGTIAAGEDDIGAGFGEGASEVLAEAAAGSGNDRGFSREVKERVAGGCVRERAWTWGRGHGEVLGFRFASRTEVGSSGWQRKLYH